MARLQEEKNYMDFGSKMCSWAGSGGRSGSAGNLIASGTLARGKHRTLWRDPGRRLAHATCVSSNESTGEV